MKRMVPYAMILLTGCLLATGNTASAHTRQGTVTLQGSMLFSSSSGDLYGNENLTEFTLSPSVRYFVIDHLAIGGQMELATVSQGDFSSTSFLLGPSGAYYFGGLDDKTIPYLGAGVFYRTTSSKIGDVSRDHSGSTVSLFGGVAVFLREHLALTPEASINFESLGGNSGTTFKIGLGLTGFLY